MTHTHKCRWEDDHTWFWSFIKHFEDLPPREDGCGHEWKHVRLEGVSNEEYRQAHLCPNCGAGPWYTIEDPV